MKNLILILSVVAVLHASVILGLTNPPYANIDYSFNYLPSQNALIMHGGWGPADWTVKSNVWSLANVGWEELPPGSSPQMTHHCGTLDSDRGVIVLCGKKIPNSTTNNMTWEYNGTFWQQKNDLSAGLKGDVEIAYDSLRKKVVAYVGPDYSESGMETWEYDGTNWMKNVAATNATAVGDGALMKYDPSSSNVVLITTKNEVWNTNINETWTYNGSKWFLIVEGYPTNAMLGGLAFDAARNEMVLITTDSETWSWDGNDWTLLHPEHSPTPARGFFTMAYDPLREVCSFYSGEYMTGMYEQVHPIDTWEWDGTDWGKFVPIPEPGLVIWIISVLFILLNSRL